MRARWLGHAAWLLEGNDRVVIDPFLTGNPKATMRSTDVKCDIVVVTHGHGDHLGNAIGIAKRNGATLCAIYEIAVYAESKGAKAEQMNKGGAVKVGGTTVRLVDAIHSGDFIGPKGDFVPGGSACGALIETGKTVYHAGDTAAFSDMKLIGELYKPDLCLLPIGGRFTMGPVEASYAAAWVNAPLTIPMHYNTFPGIQADPTTFELECVKRGYKGTVKVLEPGDWIDV